MKFKGMLFLAALCFFFNANVWAAETTPTAIQADVIEYNTKTGYTTATGNVIITQADSVATAAVAEYNTKTQAGELRGGVRVTETDGWLNCATLVLHDADHFTAVGSVAMKKTDKIVKAEKVDYYKDRAFAETGGSWGEVSMDDGSNLRAAYLNYDGRTGLITARNNVEITSTPNNLTASSDEAVYDTKAGGVIELRGNATAVQNGNTITGNTLRIINGGATAEAQGNVKLVYQPEEHRKVG